MSVQEQAPILQDPEITVNSAEGFMHKPRMVGKKSVSQVIENPKDFYVDWGFTD